jgi:hypothetical protein
LTKIQYEIVFLHSYVERELAKPTSIMSHTKGELNMAKQKLGSKKGFIKYLIIVLWAQSLVLGGKFQ